MYKQSVKAPAEMQRCLRVLSIAPIDAGDRLYVPRAPIQIRFDVWYRRRRSAPGQPGRRRCSSDIEIQQKAHNARNWPSIRFTVLSFTRGRRRARKTKLLSCVPLAGWLIREIPDCASSPKAHFYSTENRCKMVANRRWLAMLKSVLTILLLLAKVLVRAKLVSHRTGT